MNVLIVDDEPLAQEILVSYVEKFPEIQLIGCCNNALEANEVLKKEAIDLILLDIQMPKISGIEFLKTLDSPPMAILTTAFSDYALDAYSLNVIDYLLKPISFERFAKAIKKSIQHLPKTSKPTDIPSDFIYVKADKKLIKVFYEDLRYIEGLKDYVILHVDNKRIVTLQTMKSLEIKLPSAIFMRIHRSYIVNLRNIDVLEGNTVHIGNKMIPIGKNYKEELLKIINKNRL
jgi:DNA-binding LytR/AlgR family response regulator